MVKSRTALVLSALRWLRWFFQYAVVYPMATMMLLIVTALWGSVPAEGEMTP
ncbi:conjugal transfer protein TraP [Klebsiella michiganensis]|uniref:conjugal transfer protein TraP n=1 Tax=Klebsiella michiganensis TaxID=1134687 RepID=UPI0012B7C10D|nr:conjugal transfer protein TraP [Klebsiella michiganensis]